MVLAIPLMCWLETFLENKGKGRKIWKQRQGKVKASLNEMMEQKKMKTEFPKDGFRAEDENRQLSRESLDLGRSS